MSSTSGDTGLEDGADLLLNPGYPRASGNGVEQISQLRREGWFRNVHAVHAIVDGSLVGGGVEDLESVNEVTDTDDAGSEVDRVSVLG